MIVVRYNCQQKEKCRERNVYTATCVNYNRTRVQRSENNTLSFSIGEAWYRSCNVAKCYVRWSRDLFRSDLPYDDLINTVQRNSKRGEFIACSLTKRSEVLLRNEIMRKLRFLRLKPSTGAYRGTWNFYLHFYNPCNTQHRRFLRVSSLREVNVKEFFPRASLNLRKKFVSARWQPISSQFPRSIPMARDETRTLVERKTKARLGRQPWQLYWFLLITERKPKNRSILKVTNSAEKRKSLRQSNDRSRFLLISTFPSVINGHAIDESQCRPNGHADGDHSDGHRGERKRER